LSSASGPKHSFGEGPPPLILAVAICCCIGQESIPLLHPRSAASAGTAVYGSCSSTAMQQVDVGKLHL
jgi:hypothetical protein